MDMHTPSCVACGWVAGLNNQLLSVTQQEPPQTWYLCLECWQGYERRVVPGHASVQRRHWLTRAKQAMEENGYGTYWQPGTTAWKQYMPKLRHPYQAIWNAQRRGFLTKPKDGTIPQLTEVGYEAI